MTEKYKIIDTDGQVVTHMQAERLPTLGWLGPYEVRFSSATEFVVLCPPELRKPHEWNFTIVRKDEEGILHFADNDIELDPYHMCLLYQLIKEKMIDGTFDPV